MELTPQEIKMIERLRKQQRQWKLTRWIVLALGILSAAGCVIFGYFFYRIIFESSQAQPDWAAVLLVIFFWTKCVFYFLFSIWCFATVISKWHGDTNRVLLLKLLDKIDGNSK